MNDRIMQFRVGVVVLATSIVGAILVTLNGPTSTEWIPGLQRTYQVTINLSNAPGIGPNTPIRKSGLLIGRVANVEDMQDHVAVIANIDSGRLLYANYDVQVRSTLLGDSTIEFIARPIAPGEQPVGEGFVFAGTVAPNPLDGLADIEGDLKIMINKLSEAGDGVTQLAKTLNAALGTEPEAGRVPKLLDTAEQSMADLSRAAQTFDKFFGDPELMSTVREARMTMNDVRDVAKAVQAPVESIDRNLKNLEVFDDTGPCDLMSWRDWDPHQLRYGNYVDAMAMIRKSILTSVGGYTTDPRLYGWEDFALWCTLAERGWRGVRVPEIVARYRRGLLSMISLTDIDGRAAWSALLESSHSVLTGP